MDTTPAVDLENPFLFPALHLPLQRFQPEMLVGVRRALQQDGLAVWFPAYCLSLPAFLPPSFPDSFLSSVPSEPLHFCSLDLSFVISVVEQNYLFFELSV